MARLTASDILQYSIGKLPKKIADGLSAPRPTIHRTADRKPIDALTDIKPHDPVPKRTPLFRKPLAGLAPGKEKSIAEQLTGSLPKNIGRQKVETQNDAPTSIALKNIAPENIAPQSIASETAAPEIVAPKIIEPTITVPINVAPPKVEPIASAPRVAAPQIVRPLTAVPKKSVRPAEPPTIRRIAGESEQEWEPLPSMERTKLLHQTIVALLGGVWVFLLLSLGSFHVTDWPSHDVYPYGPIQNLCGSVGAFISYYSFLAIGQGVFPILFFTGVLLALLASRSRLSDPWLRIVGLGVLTVAFAAIVHHLRPGSFNGMPEGHGGIVGIGTSTYLQAHFNTVGTRLILFTAMMVGLLLAADDLVLRTPGFVAVAYANVREHTPAMPKMPTMKAFKFNFPSLPKFASLPNFRTKEIKIKPVPEKPKKTKEKAASGLASAPVIDDDEDTKPEVLLKISPATAVAPPAAEPAVDEPRATEPEPVMSAPEIKRDIVVKLPSMMKARQVSPPTPATTRAR